MNIIFVVEFFKCQIDVEAPGYVRTARCVPADMIPIDIEPDVLSLCQ